MAFVNRQAQFRVLKFRCRQNICVSVREYPGNLPLGFLYAIGSWRMACENLGYEPQVPVLQDLDPFKERDIGLRIVSRLI